MGAAGRIGGYGTAEEWGREHTDVGDVVGVVQNVERIDGDGESGDIFLFIGPRFEHEIVGEVEIEIDEAGAMKGIACEAGRTIIYDAVTVVVRTGGDVYGFTRIKRKCSTDSKEIREMR